MYKTGVKNLVNYSIFILNSILLFKMINDTLLIETDSMGNQKVQEDHHYNKVLAYLKRQ